MRLIFVVIIVLCFALPALAQTPRAEEIYSTLTAGGQVARFDYAANASDVHIANLLTALLISLWSMFFFVLFINFVKGLKA